MGSGVYSNKRMILGELINKLGPIIRKPEIATERSYTMYLYSEHAKKVVRKEIKIHSKIGGRHHVLIECQTKETGCFVHTHCKISLVEHLFYTQ